MVSNFHTVPYILSCFLIVFLTVLLYIVLQSSFCLHVVWRRKYLFIYLFMRNLLCHLFSNLAASSSSSAIFIFLHFMPEPVAVMRKLFLQSFCMNFCAPAAPAQSRFQKISTGKCRVVNENIHWEVKGCERKYPLGSIGL